MRLLRAAGAFALCVVIAVLLLLADRHGQQSRCTWLRDHHSPAATTYQCTTTGAP